MLIFGVVLFLLGKLLQSRFSDLLQVLGIILIVVGIILMFTPYRLY